VKCINCGALFTRQRPVGYMRANLSRRGPWLMPAPPSPFLCSWACWRDRAMKRHAASWMRCFLKE
jgi:hypothetical protein